MTETKSPDFSDQESPYQHCRTREGSAGRHGHAHLHPDAQWMFLLKRWAWFLLSALQMPTLAVPLTFIGMRQQTQRCCPSLPLVPLSVWCSRSLGLWPVSVIYITGLGSPAPTPISVYGVMYGSMYVWGCVHTSESDYRVRGTLGLEIQWS